MPHATLASKKDKKNTVAKEWHFRYWINAGQAMDDEQDADAVWNITISSHKYS